jgi:hypothetical protein
MGGGGHNVFLLVDKQGLFSVRTLSELGTNKRVFLGGMRHTSTALYFYGASKKTLHKPQAIFGNMLFQINYGLKYYLQLLCL